MTNTQQQDNARNTKSKFIKISNSYRNIMNKRLSQAIST